MKRNLLIITYIHGHFAVDFASAYLMYRLVYETQQWAIYILIYNFCAFALQMPIGLIADRVNHNSLCAAIGCCMVALAYGIGTTSMVSLAVILGVGNALFHVGGGIDILNRSNGKVGLLGAFVSPGAIGIYLGTILGKKQELSGWMIVLALIITSLVIVLSSYRRGLFYRSENVPLTFRMISFQKGFLAAGCFLVVVMIRSYLGMTANYSWKSQDIWGIVFICAIALGKLAGGYLADWIGVQKAAIISLALSAILFLLSASPWCGVAAVFFFNMTMPITLWALTKLLAGSKGFSFGVLTFGLFLGFVPVYLGFNALLSTTMGFATVTSLSLFLIWFGLRKAGDEWECI